MDPLTIGMLAMGGLSFASSSGLLDSLFPGPKGPDPVAHMRERLALTKKLANEYDKAYNSAKDANEKRYNEIKTARISGRDAGNSAINEQLESSKAGLTTAGKKAGASAAKATASKGLGAAAAVAAQKGAASAAADASGRVAQEGVERKIARDVKTEEQVSRFIEGRDDSYPDPKQFASLMAQLGAARGALENMPPEDQFGIKNVVRGLAASGGFLVPGIAGAIGPGGGATAAAAPVAAPVASPAPHSGAYYSPSGNLYSPR
jgi:hypothetical protein